MIEIVGQPTKARLLLLRILNRWGIQTYVVLDNYETKNSLGVYSLNCEHVLVKKQNFQLIKATYAPFFMKNDVAIGEREYADESFS